MINLDHVTLPTSIAVLVNVCALSLITKPNLVPRGSGDDGAIGSKNVRCLFYESAATLARPVSETSPFWRCRAAARRLSIRSAMRSGTFFSR